MIDGTHLYVEDRPQVFLDSWLIEATGMLTRRWHKPRQRQDRPVLARDRPWEINPYFTYSNYCVLQDPADGQIKCWYEDLGPHMGGVHPMKNRLLYAVSSDGVRFEKPQLDIVSHEGRPTNIVAGHTLGGPASAANAWPTEGVHSCAIVIDPHPPSGDERFRMIFSRRVPDSRKTSGWRRVTACARSADGIHWVPYPDPPRLGTSGTSLGDVSCVRYDANSRCFVQNTRHGCMWAPPPPGTPRESTTWAAAYAPHRPDLMNKRRVFRTFSHDFLHWSDPVRIVGPDDVFDNIDESHYGMASFHVGNVEFGTLGVFRATDNEMDVRLLFSRDGARWAPADRARPFLRPRGPEHWDAHMVSIASPPIRMGDELWFYHGGSSCHHDWWISGRENLAAPEAQAPPDHVRFGLGIAALRLDGFCSLDAGPYRDGFVMTKPLFSQGDQLIVNARCRPGGWLRAAVTDLEGRCLGSCTREQCDAFAGDSVDHVLSWNGERTIPAGGTFRRVILYLRDAEVFSFRFRESAEA